MTFVTFANVSCKVCTQLYRTETNVKLSLTFVTLLIAVSQKYLRHHGLPNSTCQICRTFVTFENESCEMCTQLHIIETSMPNSLWHSSLLKNSDSVFAYADTAAQVNTKPPLFSNTVGVSKSAYRPKNYLRTLGARTKLTYADTVFLKNPRTAAHRFPAPG